MHNYDHKAIEAKWQKRWEDAGIYRTEDSVPGKENYYALVEFPYPSGNLHIGHWYAFAVPDIFARYKRMKGYNVLFPFGFDSFGLPAENAAIKNKLDPREWTYANIESMSSQVRSMGNSFDWSRKVVTSDPDYYRWTQWMFLQFFKNNLAYRATELANWCPSCQTVLANEQVKNDVCERCGTEVDKREQATWFLKITKFAERLLSGLDDLNWPEEIKESQRNWIGKSEGAILPFDIVENREKGQKVSRSRSTEKVVILHGYAGTPDDHFIPWLKSELEILGYDVVAPLLPHHTDEEVPEKDSIEAALAATEYDENTHLIGFSLGSVVAIKLLETFERPIKSTTLIAGFADPEFKDKSRSFETTYSWQFSGEKINRNAGLITLLHDTGDYAVSNEQGERLAQLLDTPLTKVKAEAAHFLSPKEPTILERLLITLSAKPTISVFTTRPDTLFGATYLVLAPEHPNVAALKYSIENWSEAEAYIKKAQATKDIERTAEGREKTGVKLEGVVAINPATKKEIPVYIADYVLAHYGTGAIMAVPAHDERDYAFAKKFGLPIQQVLLTCEQDPNNPQQEKYGAEVRRDMAIVYLRDRSTGKYALLDWHGSLEGITTTIMGGIEEGQTPEAAALAEVKEEAALTASLIKKLEWLTASRYCASHKEQNRMCIAHTFLAEVDSLDAQGSIADDEQQLHTLVWIDAPDVEERITTKHGKQLWKLLQQESPLLGEGVVINSDQYDGLESNDAKQKITEAVGGKLQATYKLRDWSLSRQRYWGAPIPIVYDPEGNPHAVPDEHLPWTLPDDVDFTPTGEAPLARSQELKERTEKIFGEGWTPEVDTFDTFIDSSWYFLRYTDPKNEMEFAAKDKLQNWMPVDRYSGGAEHTTMHVLYSRFWQKALFDLELVANDEPYKERMNRGQILGPDGKKMSKSKGNVVDPDEHVERVGADTVRLYLAFMGPYNQTGQYPFDLGGVAGMRRFLERVMRLKTKIGESDSPMSEACDRLRHQTIKKVGEDIEAYKFNTAISQIMVLVNALEKEPAINLETFKALIRLLSPFTPHIADELWEQMGETTSVHIADWPTYDESMLAETTTTIAIQINGKMRGTMDTSFDTPQSELVSQARALPAIAKWLSHEPIKVIHIPNKVLNFIVPED